MNPRIETEPLADWYPLTQQFKLTLKVSGRSPRTAEAYDLAIRELLHHLLKMGLGIENRRWKRRLLEDIGDRLFASEEGAAEETSGVAKSLERVSEDHPKWNSLNPNEPFGSRGSASAVTGGSLTSLNASSIARDIGLRLGEMSSTFEKMLEHLSQQVGGIHILLAQSGQNSSLGDWSTKDSKRILVGLCITIGIERSWFETSLGEGVDSAALWAISDMLFDSLDELLPQLEHAAGTFGVYYPFFVESYASAILELSEREDTWRSADSCSRVRDLAGRALCYVGTARMLDKSEERRSRLAVSGSAAPRTRTRLWIEIDQGLKKVIRKAN